MRHIHEKAVFLLFFLSGVCGLIYEVIWGKYLSLFIGNTTHAHMIVLATFMGGLAAGSYLFGRVADRIARPLKLYAYLEIGVGLYGVLYAPIIGGVRDVYFSMASTMDYGSLPSVFLKLLLAFITLLPSACMMGGTLPALSRYMIRAPGAVGDRVSLLYFINSFGAVAGALIAGFYVIEQAGLIRGLILTGVINVGIGLLILGLDRLSERKEAALEPEQEPAIRYEERYITLAMVCIFLSGFTALVYELVWFRIFAVALESSTYSFSLMLAAFISGITAGSLVAGRVMARSRRLLFFFGISELAIALIILFTMPFYERMPYYFWRVRYLLNPVPDTFFLYNLAKFTLCFMTMFLPTLFFGMTLPFVSHIASDRMNELARKIGSVFAANTVGTLLGALTAGLALIPYFGLFRSLEITVAINFALGLALLLRTPDIPSPRWRRGALAVSLGAALFYWVALPHGDASRFALGVFRNRTAPPTSFSEFTASSFFNFELAYYKEDLSGNVAVLKQVNEQNQPRLSLTVNGKADASSDSDAPTQTLLAQLPLLMKNGSSAVLLIGMGSGMTAGSALTHPLERLDCVEISTGVAEAARLFGPYNNNVYENPRFHLIVEDARTFVNITDRRYDVIISEPSNPWMAGVGNLFTIEFFRDAARIMPDDGVMAQWFHLYEVSDEIVGTAVRTFQTVFPYTYIFQGNSTDIIMLGSRRPFEPDFDRLKEKMAAPEIRDDLAKIRIHDLSGLLGLQMISPEHIPGIAALGDINSDYIPLIEYRAPAAFYQGARAQKITEADERYTIGDRLLLHRYMEKDTLTVENLRHLIALFDARPTDVEALAFPLMARYLALQPQDAGIGRRFAEISLTRKNYGGTLDLYRPLLEGGDAALFERYADLLYDQERPYHSVFTPGSFDEAMTALREGQARFPDVETFLIRLGRASLASGRYEQAFEYFQQAQQRRGSETTPDDELPTLLGRAAYHLRRYEQAKQYIDAALKINPRNVIALQYYLLIDQAVKLTMK